MQNQASLRMLVRDCTVRLLIQDRGMGTGFFVAPGLIVTCAHVVEEALKRQIPVEVHTWKGQKLGQTHVDRNKFFLEEIPIQGSSPRQTYKYPDLALLSIGTRDHPCVYLDNTLEAQEELFSYGYVQSFAGGDEAEFTYEGISQIDADRRVLKFREGQVTYGLSGGPLLNVRTGGICGIVQISRNLQGDLGGRAIPTDVIFACFPELEELQEQFHQSDPCWIENLTFQQYQILNLTSLYPKITFQEIVEKIQARKSISQLPTLVLGSRTGGFYALEKLYTTVGFSSTEPDAFEQLSTPAKFKKSYEVLKENFTDLKQMDELFRNLLANQAKFRREDRYMAEMIYAGYFDVVISTPIDSFLRQAWQYYDVLDYPKEEIPHEFLICGFHPIGAITRNYRQTSKIIKIFGDLEMPGTYYSFNHELDLDDPSNEQLKAYLQAALAKPTIVIGYDPAWDSSLEKAFPLVGDEIIYVNEEKLEGTSNLAKAVKSRGGKWLIEDGCDFPTLIPKLYTELISDSPISFDLVRRLVFRLEGIQRDITSMYNKQQELGKKLSKVHNSVSLLERTVQQFAEGQTSEDGRNDQF